MNILDEIFAEYVRMRENGLDTKEALRTLRAYIEALDMQDKEFLAQQLRTWERNQAPTPPSSEQDSIKSQRPEPVAPPEAQQPPPPPKKRRKRPAPSPDEASTSAKPSPLIKPLKSPPQANNTPETSHHADETTQSTPPYGGDIIEEVWVACGNCGAKNRTTEVFCYACGQLLDASASQFDTRHFASATDELYSEEYFGRDSVILLHVRDHSERYEIRPQLRNHEVVIGRSSGSATAMRPDIDLATADAANFGVSRLHMALRYEDNDDNVVVYDLGSANGSFINGQRLHPKEIRILRNGDELRLGRMVMRVIYRHPGEPLS
jgi:hypothetical protein